MLAFDDMNMRGQQILDGFDYVEGSVSEYIDLILNRGRGSNLLEYVNYQTASRIAKGELQEGYIAVPNGASFTVNPDYMLFNEDNQQYNMDTSNYMSYLGNGKIPCRGIDWSSKDIVNGVGTEEAIKICKSRGFELIRSIPLKSKSDDDGQSMLFYNSKTGDLITVKGAKEDNFCYAGCKLYAYRKERAKTICTSGYSENAECFYHQYGYQDGLFRGWDVFHKNTSCINQGIEISKMGWGISGLSILHCFNMPFILDSDLPQKVGKYADVFSNLGSYHLEGIINHVLFFSLSDSIAEKVPAFKNYKNWFLNSLLASTLIWGMGDNYNNLVIIKVAIDYLRVPSAIELSWVNGIRNRLSEYDARENERRKNQSVLVRKSSKLLKTFDKDKQLLSTFDDSDTIIKGLGLPDIDSLAVKPKWW